MLPPLPEEVIRRLPRYYTAVTDLYDAPFLKTSQATALFALTSAMMPNSYVRHGKRLVSPAVMVIHYGTSGAGKGNISDLRTLFEAIDRRRIEESERALQRTTTTWRPTSRTSSATLPTARRCIPRGVALPRGCSDRGNPCAARSRYLPTPRRPTSCCASRATSPIPRC